jgi:predicted SAM-dependent methyltransferase
MRLDRFHRALSRAVRMRLTRRKADRYLSDGKPIRLDLGCGDRCRPGFTGVDIAAGADLYWDLSRGLPFPDDTVAEIRSDHCLEHLPLPTVVHVLRECRRVLISGGRLEFTVPHLNPYLEAYHRGDFEVLAQRICDIPAGEETFYDTPFDRIAWLLHRAGEHRSMFDRDSIVSKVRLAGFQHVTTRDPNGTDANLRYSSVYVVACK